jgi:hypothetical protein
VSAVGRIIAGAIGVLVLVGALSGCNWDGRNDFSYDTSKKVVSDLRPHEKAGKATVDFGELVTGDWERLLIVCPSVSTDDIDGALGFPWADGREATRTDFLGMMVFASNKDVLGYYSVGQNDPWENHFYFTPCPISPGDLVGDYPHVLVVPRADSRVTFQYSASVTYWVVDAATLGGMVG